MADWIIPLSSESICENWELRLLLRSLERHAKNLDRVVVVGDALPTWLCNVEKVKCGDPLPANKDGNIIDKIVKAVTELQIKSFIFSADDNILLQDCDVEKIPVLCTSRTQADFEPKIAENKGKSSIDWNRWRKRVYHTFWLAEEMGYPIEHDYESHAPQRYADADIIVEGLKKVRYRQGLGYTICTLFRLCEAMHYGHPIPGVCHKGMKITWEDANKIEAPKPHHVFGGYNDSTFVAGVKDWLTAIYPEPSKYENDGGL